MILEESKEVRSFSVSLQQLAGPLLSRVVTVPSLGLCLGQAGCKIFQTFFSPFPSFD